MSTIVHNKLGLLLNRTRAEKPATMEKVSADPNIGAIVKQTTMADLTAKYSNAE